MILEFKGKKPRIDEGVFVAPTAVVVGDVEIKPGASIWFGTVIRGDLAPVRIGRNTNIQDNCTVHTDVGKPAIIGDNVTVGHNAVVHGCTVENDCLIGINAVVLSTARVRTGSVVAAGSLVRQGDEIGPYHLVAGVPCERKKQLSEETAAERRKTAESYVDMAEEYRKLLNPVGNAFRK